MTGKKAVILGAGTLVLTVVVVKAILFFVDLFQPNRLPAQDWAIFQENFISPEGRVIDTGNGNVSHSEGQGYGLLIAAAYDDRKTFDRIWEWTQKNLQTRPNDKLLSWQWKPDPQAPGGGAVSDSNNASDGELLVAWALLRAFRQWDDYKYQTAAAQILADLARLDVVETKEHGLVLLPGSDGFVHDGVFTLNLSYYIFPALRDMGAAFPGSVWSALEKSGKALVDKARFGRWNLPPDWIQFQATAMTTALPVIDVQPSSTASAEPTPLGRAITVPAESADSGEAKPAAEAASPPPDQAADLAPSSTPEQVAAVPAKMETPVSGKIEVSTKFPPDFGYNAVRIPLHLGWQNSGSPELVPFATYWKQYPLDKIPATINVLTGEPGPDPALPGMRAIASFTMACADKRILTVRSLPVLTKGDSYFSASLSILTKIAVRESFAK